MLSSKDDDKQSSLFGKANHIGNMNEFIYSMYYANDLDANVAKWTWWIRREVWTRFGSAVGILKCPVKICATREAWTPCTKVLVEG